MDLGVWLRSLGLEQYEASFRENAIDDTVLPSLTAEDLKDLGVGIVGHRRKLLDAIAALRADANAKAALSDALFKNTAERRQIRAILLCLTFNHFRQFNCRIQQRWIFEQEAWCAQIERLQFSDVEIEIGDPRWLGAHQRFAIFVSCRHKTQSSCQFASRGAGQSLNHAHSFATLTAFAKDE